ncbi:17254_t:CDS:2 [Funneliformis caledonium]|uniref:17254_t:CDS:1 n=2 Tax=Funneliformis TaxID=1117308 RepID=A0A9N9GD01_9GLOM|nr:17254_t:CDS:2 [Funneliformis caledonium]CAG8682603.1 10333_t:CDS:2 [Funneliformis mosseae]
MSELYLTFKDSFFNSNETFLRMDKMSTLSNSNNECTFTLSERLESESGPELTADLEPKVNGSVGSVGVNNPPKISFAISKPPEHVKLGDDDAENLQEQKSSTSIEQIVTIKTEPTETNTLEATNTNNNVGSTGENKKKRKRSRWDQAGITTVQETPALSIDLKSIQSANAGGAAATSVNSAPPQQSYTFSDKRKFVKYSDTYKSGMVRIGSKWVYPEDEITDGGTWEHKKRAEEMKKTAEQAALLTSHAEAKRAHHIADFLPKEELEKFEQKVKAIKTGGTTPTYEDYASNKLDQSNIGFKMLMKQGWQAGSGLGKSGEGIAAPINKADSRPANAGLGQTKPEGVDEEDDEFEIYRKRMMLAYRFRPNPLNNPRRPYY